MRKEKFFYNKHTLQYEKIEPSLKTKFFRIMGLVLSTITVGVIFAALIYKYNPSPRELNLLHELNQVKTENLAISDQMELMSKVLHNIQDRDAGVYRMLFGMDPIDNDMWNGGIGGHTRYQNLRNMEDIGEVLLKTREKADQLKLRMSLQSKSLDKLEVLVKDKEKMLASIPAIKPIREDKLKRNITSLSGFGMRMHPVYKRKKMHTGLDFTSPKGTPIQATGDGKVFKIFRKKSGYGNHVIIDHGYGYKTLYGHMSVIDVKVGQKVKRGQTIGKVGNTGTSTAPHLHYEVIEKDRKINPIHFCMDGLTPQEYQELADKAGDINQSFD